MNEFGLELSTKPSDEMMDPESAEEYAFDLYDTFLEEDEIWKEAFGLEMRKWRLLNGETISQLCSEVGCTTSYLIAIENFRASLTHYKAAQIVETLDPDEEDFADAPYTKYSEEYLVKLRKEVKKISVKYGRKGVGVPITKKMLKWRAKFGKALTAVKQAKKLNNVKIADIIGFSPQYVSQIQNGKHLSSLRAKEIAEKLGSKKLIKIAKEML